MADKDADIRSDLDRLRRKSTRMDAVARLGEAGATEAIEPLLRLCRHVTSDDRGTIAKALARMGEPAVKPLIKRGLGDRSDHVRRCAAHALALMGSTAQKAYPSLLRGLDDKSLGVRLQVIDALGRIGGGRAVEPLVGLLEDDEGDVRQQAASALGGLGEPGLTAARKVLDGSGSLRTRVLAAYALSCAGGEGVAHLRRVYEDRSLPSKLRVAILSYLKDFLGAEVLPLAEAALDEEDKRIRRQAARCFCEIDAPAATSRLIALYQDEDKKVRALILCALRTRYKTLIERIEGGDASVLPALLAAWRTMQDPQEAGAVAKALVRMGQALVPDLAALLDPEQPGADVIDVLARIGPGAAAAYERLVALLDHPDVATCCAAARALGSLGDERAIPVLAARLSFDADLLRTQKQKRARKRALGLQRAAAEGMGRLGRASLGAALDAARGADPAARLGGVIALGYVGGGRALATIERAAADPDDVVREAAADALERAAAQDVTRLGRMLKSKDDHVRAKVVTVLGKLDDLRSLDLLLRAYGDPSPRVHEAVVQVLAQREGERVNSILIAAAAGGNTTAIHALKEHPVRQGIPALVEALDSPWYEVYSVALEAIRAYVEVYGEDVDTMATLRQVIPELVYLLHDDSAKTRRIALETLGAFRDPETAGNVADLLLDEKRSVQMAAARVLASTGGSEVIALVKERTAAIKDENLREEIEALFAGDDGEVL
jgi:HEAT repeat protein